MSAQASNPEPGKVGGWRIDPGEVQLIELTLRRLDIPPESEANAEREVNFELTAIRATIDKIGVVLGLKVLEPGLADITVRAGTILTVTLPDETQDREQQLADIAAQMGPIIIYPYLRELVADLTRRTGTRALTLPIYQIGTFFKLGPKDIKLLDRPQATEESAEKATKKPSKSPTRKEADPKSKKPKKKG